MLTLYALKGYCDYKSLRITNTWSQEIVAQIRDDVTEKLMQLPMEFYDLNDSSYVAARITEVNHLLAFFSQSTIKSTISIFEFFGVLLILLIINPFLTLLLLLISPLFFKVSKNYANILNKTSAAVLEDNSRLDSRVQKSFKNIEEIKNLSAEKEEQGKIRNANIKLLKSNIDQSNTIAKSMEILTFLSSFSTIILIILGGVFMIRSNFTIGDYMVFSSLIGRLFAPMQTFSMLSITLRPALISLDRIIEFTNEKIDIEDKIYESRLPLKKINSVKFEKVNFSYKTSSNPVLNELSFEIKGADKVCIKGPNGSGKTTIFRLLLSLYDIQGGSIFVNDSNIDMYNKADVRKRIAIVSQKIKLFPGTIEENIRYGCAISDEEYAIKISNENLKVLLEKLPRNIDIIDGENLSGGQIQRIAIARGLIRDADLFLFDEATSNLDYEGSHDLINLVADLLKEKKCIFIEHDNIADKICNKVILL